MPDDRIALPWAVHSSWTAEDEKYIAKYMQKLESDIGCFDTIHVNRSQTLETEHVHGILFVPGSLAGGGCYSALGLRPGYYGRTTGVYNSVTGFGARETWQVISIDGACNGPNEASIHHEGTGSFEII